MDSATRRVYDVEMEVRSKHLFEHLFRYANVEEELTADGKDKDGVVNRRVRVTIPSDMQEDFESRLRRRLTIFRDGNRFRPSREQ